MREGGKGGGGGNNHLFRKCGGSAPRSGCLLDCVRCSAPNSTLHALEKLFSTRSNFPSLREHTTSVYCFTNHFALATWTWGISAMFLFYQSLATCAGDIGDEEQHFAGSALLR